MCGKLPSPKGCKRRFSISFVFLLTILALSCNGNKTALIWTDRPEFAFYGEHFNTVQNKYKVEIRFFESPAAELEKSNIRPDIIAGSWLKNTSTGTHFKSMDKLFGANKLSRSVFYPRLLTIGRIERNQFLLPVSFNAPAVIFAQETSLQKAMDGEQGLSNPFTIDFDEIKNLSRDYNIINRGTYTRMGFSPLWNDDFLFITATLFGSSFREASPLAWDDAALERSMDFVSDWIHEINTGYQAEDDFTFKYFFEPPAKLIQSGRILFSYMESSALFTLNDDVRNNLDFRWITGQNNIPLTEGSVYLGIPKRGKSPKAAAAFIYWFFRVETQQKLLEESRANRMNETVFGICGGFSALSPVTEQIFPRFYPGLLGRMPPSEYLTPANSLPANWITLKERIVLPYLHDRARKGEADEVQPLEKRIADWMRVNR